MIQSPIFAANPVKKDLKIIWKDSQRFSDYDSKHHFCCDFHKYYQDKIGGFGLSDT